MEVAEIKRWTKHKHTVLQKMFKSRTGNDQNETPITVSVRKREGGGLNGWVGRGQKGPELLLLPSQADTKVKGVQTGKKTKALLPRQMY